MMVAILKLLLLFSKSSAFSPNCYIRHHHHKLGEHHHRLQQKSDDYVDAEFYPVEPDQNSSSSTSSVSPSTPKKMSPLQISLTSVEPKLSSLSFNFIDPALKSASKQSFIPCRIAYIINYNNVEYVLGTPVDKQVAIFVEDLNSNTAYFIDSDEDDNMEIMERAASVFEQQYKYVSLSDDDEDEEDEYDSDDDNHNYDGNTMNKRGTQKLSIRFKRTPRTLTVEGDLGMITGNWKEDGKRQFEEVKDVASDVLNDSNEHGDDEFFDLFFSKELGSDYKEKAMANSDIDEEQVQELMDLFNVPGLGTEKDDDEGIDSIFKDIRMDEKIAVENGTESMGGSTALRLIGFGNENDDGKIYSLVQLLQPMILIAKTDSSLEFDEKMLLTQEEADEIVPILEKQFKDEFEGVTLK
jgi:hypothetical protein